MNRPQAGSWGNELNDLVRALSGTFLFGAPLLFTMEMWWIGLYSEGWKLLTLLALALAANLGLASTVGFHRGATLAHAIDQAVDAMAMGVLAALVVLLTLHRLTFSDPGGILGKVIIQAVPLSIGASVANAIFGGNGRDDEARARAVRRAPSAPRCTTWALPPSARCSSALASRPPMRCPCWSPGWVPCTSWPPSGCR